MIAGPRDPRGGVSVWTVKTSGWLAAALVLLTSGCGAGDQDEPTAADTSEASSPSAPADFTATGEIYVDELTSIRLKRNPDRCVATGDLAKFFAEDASSVVITAPDGDEVALGRILIGKPPTYMDKGEEFYAIGECNFPFTAVDIPAQDGVFTASIPELDIETRFTQDEAIALRLEFD